LVTTAKVKPLCDSSLHNPVNRLSKGHTHSTATPQPSAQTTHYSSTPQTTCACWQSHHAAYTQPFQHSPHQPYCVSLFLLLLLLTLLLPLLRQRLLPLLPLLLLLMPLLLPLLSVVSWLWAGLPPPSPRSRPWPPPFVENWAPAALQQPLTACLSGRQL
jgi:hypothetical protein